MAVKLEKAKKAKKAEPIKAAKPDGQLVDAAKVDEYLTLKHKLDKAAEAFAAKHAADNKRLGELQAEMVKVADDNLAADASVQFVGTKPELGAGIEVSAKRSTTIITDLSMVRKYLTDKVFMTLAKVNIGDLDKYLTPPQKAACTKSERTGSRGFKVL